MKASHAPYCLQEESFSPAAGHYTGKGIELKVAPAYLESKPARLELTFPVGTVLEDVTLEIGGTTILNLSRCTLRRVALKLAVKSTASLQDCVLEDCYISFKEVVYGRKDGTRLTLNQAYEEFGAPKLNMTNCVVAASTLVSPFLSGLTATRCTFLSCALEADTQDGKQRTSRYVECLFNSSKLVSADVLLTTSQCRFKECQCSDVLSETAGNLLLEPVTLQLAWENGSPALPPKTANGHVSFEPITTAIEVGATHSHEWDGDHLKVPDLPVAENAAAQPLQDLWKLLDYNLFKARNWADAPTPPSPNANPAEPPTVVAANLAFKSRLSHVNGLLIQQLLSGEEAGMVSKMSLTALPALGSAPSVVKFNQAVGDDMQKALSEVSKFTQLRYGGLPGGHTVEVGFADKYVPKDGPSAAVACALLLESAITGKKWDPAFAVTGDMNADGSVQPIGGVQAKIRGATNGTCKLVGVPVKNEKAVMDVLLLEGPAPLVGITVFGIKTFEDALLLADPERPQALQSALTDFDNMRTVMMRDRRQIIPLLRTPHAAQRLQALLAAAPNCYSAKYLLLYVQNRLPRSLSIGGSIEAAQGSAASILAAIEHDVDTNMSSLKGDELGTSLNRLRTLRPLLDQRVWPYVDNLVVFGEVIRGSVLNPVRSGARYADLVGRADKAASAAKAAYGKLISDAQVREELGL